MHHNVQCLHCLLNRSYGPGDLHRQESAVLANSKQMPNVHLLSKEGVGESQPFDIKSKMSRNDEKFPSLSSLMKR